MPTSFLSSEEYDERAHQLYNDGDYEGALQVLKEGLTLYPHSVELYVGLGYAQLAREDYLWAKHALDKALVLDPENEDAMVGLGEVLLRLGHAERALALFGHVREQCGGDDLDLFLTMGRALYREQLFEHARAVFSEATELRPDSPEALAGLAYTFHRLGQETAARRALRRALRLDADHHEARVYLGHLLYDRGHWVGALREFERVAPADHWDVVAIWRLLELRRALYGMEPGDERLEGWERRLRELEVEPDPIEELLAEVENAALDDAEAHDAPSGGEEGIPVFGGPHRVRTSDGHTFAGSWDQIVRQLRDRYGRAEESLEDFMRRRAAEARGHTGARVPADDAEGFLLAHAGAGLIDIEC
ncbi:MAG TPA: tetratricopeptide repeat protein, partial [Longimicrobiales bacterium]|nr:tetratricopeptide repeat protein [Longimicrobiales bacterium]